MEILTLTDAQKILRKASESSYPVKSGIELRRREIGKSVDAAPKVKKPKKQNTTSSAVSLKMFTHVLGSHAKRIGPERTKEMHERYRKLGTEMGFSIVNKSLGLVKGMTPSDYAVLLRRDYKQNGKLRISQHRQIAAHHPKKGIRVIHEGKARRMQDRIPAPTHSSDATGNVPFKGREGLPAFAKAIRGVSKHEVIGHTQSGHPIHSASHPSYQSQHKMTGWNRPVKPIEHRSLMIFAHPGHSKQDHRDAATAHAAHREMHAAAHAKVYRAAVKAHGEPARHISGNVGENFPRQVNDRLRHHAHAASAASAASATHWSVAHPKTPYHLSPHAHGRAVGYTHLGKSLEEKSMEPKLYILEKAAKGEAFASVKAARSYRRLHAGGAALHPWHHDVIANYHPSAKIRKEHWAMLSGKKSLAKSAFSEAPIHSTWTHPTTKHTITVRHHPEGGGRISFTGKNADGGFAYVGSHEKGVAHLSRMGYKQTKKSIGGAMKKSILSIDEAHEELVKGEKPLSGKERMALADKWNLRGTHKRPTNTLASRGAYGKKATVKKSEMCKSADVVKGDITSKARAEGAKPKRNSEGRPAMKPKGKSRPITKTNVNGDLQNGKPLVKAEGFRLGQTLQELMGEKPNETDAALVKAIKTGHVRGTDAPASVLAKAAPAVDKMGRVKMTDTEAVRYLNVWMKGQARCYVRGNHVMQSGQPMEIGPTTAEAQPAQGQHDLDKIAEGIYERAVEASQYNVMLLHGMRAVGDAFTVGYVKRMVRSFKLGDQKSMDISQDAGLLRRDVLG